MTFLALFKIKEIEHYFRWLKIRLNSEPTYVNLDDLADLGVKILLLLHNTPPYFNILLDFLSFNNYYKN